MGSVEQLRSNLDQAMIRGATSPNTGISQAAIRGARYLKNGGRVVIVFSLATTAYVLLTASNDELERLLHQEVGGFIGGSIGTGAAVGACLVFGIATGGWARYFENNSVRPGVGAVWRARRNSKAPWALHPIPSHRASNRVSSVSEPSVRRA